MTAHRAAGHYARVVRAPTSATRLFVECAAIVLSTLVIVGVAAFSRTTALALVALQALFAVRLLLLIVGEPMAELLLTVFKYPGSRSAHGEPDGGDVAANRALELFVFIGSFVVLAEVLIA